MPRPRSIRRSDTDGLSNAELAATFREIGDMLELLGEVPYKAVAYRRAADAIERYPADLVPLIEAGRMPKIAGVGAAIGARLTELATTGRLEYHERLREQVPPGLVGVLRIGGVGPRTARQLHLELGVTSIDELREAAEMGRIREVSGMSARTEQNILAGIARLDQQSDQRLLLHEADRLANELIAGLRDVTGVERLAAAGSLRRRRTTIGDLDLLAATTDPAALIGAFQELAAVERVIASGADKASVVLAADGKRQVDLMVCRPEAWGTHLVHFTGSKEHNVALRERALDRGLSLSEKGFRVVETGELLLDADEEAVYARLDLPWIPPELREGEGEMAAAIAGTLPRLVELDDVRGDTHTHSDWTDGVDTIETMARAARDRGLGYMVLTDHSPSLGVTRGLTPDRIAEQKVELDRLNSELAPFRILHGTEMEIRADGALDYPDELLARFDVVVASIHVGRSQPTEQLTRRCLAAIENPNVDIIAHPTGRIVNRRDPVSFDWPQVFEAAARTGTRLEINGSPRLDLDERLARDAAQAGVQLTLASDAHRTEELEYLDYAVGVARRAWLEPGQIANTAGVEGWSR
ncbi:MAG TPA: DNA polymerase/3'-5' exonuclease PolX [Candidatus Limnocylindria bacterium]